MDESKKEKWQTGRLYEIFRFVVLGAFCALIEFATNYFFVWLFRSYVFTDGSARSTLIIVGIAAALSFVISCAINFVLSRLWVYQNVDKSVNTKGPKAWLKYFAFSFVGMLIGIAVMVVAVLILQGSSGDFVDFALKVLVTNWKELFQSGGAAFWIYLGIFALKTMVVMIFNYITRKLFIFKEPKKEE